VNYMGENQETDFPALSQAGGKAVALSPPTEGADGEYQSERSPKECPR